MNDTYCFFLAGGVEEEKEYLEKIDAISPPSTKKRGKLTSTKTAATKKSTLLHVFSPG